MSSTLRARTGAAALGVVVAVTSVATAQAAAPGATIRVSVATDGSQGEYFESREPGISADGRYVVFRSGDALAANDTNPLDDVYLRDTQTGTTELISVGRPGTAVSGDSRHPKVSADGRFVVFSSDAELTPDSDWTGGTFLRDRSTGTTTRVGPDGYWFEGPELSADGGFVVFPAVADAVPQDTNRHRDVYLWERKTAKLAVVSTGVDGRTTPGDSTEPTVSDDGRYVTYLTKATALNGGVDGARAVVTDRTTRRTTVVSTLTGKEEAASGPAISGDGQWIAYALHLDGRNTDIRLWQRSTGRTVTASVSTTGKTGTGVSLNPRISADARYVAYWSSARDLVPDSPSAPMSIYRFDRATGRNMLAMTPPDEAFYGSEVCDLSDDGRFVAFESTSATLVEGDTNRRFDVFRTDIGGGEAVALQASRAPTVAGVAGVGALVTAVTGEWTFVPTSYAYQWAANGAPIKGATGRSYLVTARELGKRLTVTVTAGRAGYLPGTATSAASAAVRKGVAPKALKKPRVTGTVKVGRTVKAYAGAWSPAVSAYRYEWRVSGKVVRGATRATLKLAASMGGKKLTVTVVGQRVGHLDGKATSVAVTVRR